MTSKVPEAYPGKHEDERPIPTIWRPVLTEIADRITAGDYTLASRPSNVSPIEPDFARMIANQVTSYGDPLTGLRDETWQRGIYLWMEGYWEVLVDLCTQTQGVSDLVMFVYVYEQADDYQFKVFSVHVP